MDLENFLSRISPIDVVTYLSGLVAVLVAVLVVGWFYARNVLTGATFGKIFCYLAIVLFVIEANATVVYIAGVFILAAALIDQAYLIRVLAILRGTKAPELVLVVSDSKVVRPQVPEPENPEAVESALLAPKERISEGHVREEATPEVSSSNDEGGKKPRQIPQKETGYSVDTERSALEWVASSLGVTIVPQASISIGDRRLRVDGISELNGNYRVYEVKAANGNASSILKGISQVVSYRDTLRNEGFQSVDATLIMIGKLPPGETGRVLRAAGEAGVQVISITKDQLEAFKATKPPGQK